MSRAETYCGKCYTSHERYPILGLKPDHDEITVFETRNEDRVLCPWCGVENSSDELDGSGVLDCEECEREFFFEVDYTPDYTTARPSCFCCGAEMPKAFWTKIGGESGACSPACVDRCNAAYNAYVAAYQSDGRCAFPRRGFGKATP